MILARSLALKLNKERAIFVRVNPFYSQSISLKIQGSISEYFLNDFDIGPGLGTGDVGMDTTLHRVVACYFLLHY